MIVIQVILIVLLIVFSVVTIVGLVLLAWEQVEIRRFKRAILFAVNEDEKRYFEGLVDAIIKDLADTNAIFDPDSNDSTNVVDEPYNQDKDQDNA